MCMEGEVVVKQQACGSAGPGPAGKDRPVHRKADQASPGGGSYLRAGPGPVVTTSPALEVALSVPQKGGR
jgi:hypothetical protein